jgi:hypothetical protein
MNPIPQTISINDLCNGYDAILPLATKAPVFLTENASATGVLISITAWNQLLEKVEELQDIIDVLEAELPLALGKDEYVEMTEEYLTELQAMAAGNVLSE